MRSRSLRTAAAFVLGISLLTAVCAPIHAKGVRPPNGVKMAMLIKSTLIALNQANQTGNYTVLRDLGTSSFQQNFSASRLSDSFKKLRSRKLNIMPVLLKRPALTKPVKMSKNGIINLEGYMPTAPLSIRFKMYFQYQRKAWRLVGLAVDTFPLKKLRAAKTSEHKTKPSEPKTTAAVAPEAPKTKPTEEKKIVKKTPPPAPQPAPSQKAEPETAAKVEKPKAVTAVENRTSNDAVRIDLSSSSSQKPDETQAAPAAEEKSESGSSFWSTVNPFAD